MLRVAVFSQNFFDYEDEDDDDDDLSIGLGREASLLYRIYSMLELGFQPAVVPRDFSLR